MSRGHANAGTPRRFFQISLRTAIVLLTALCVWGAFQVNRAQKQKRVIEKIKALNGIFWYDYQIDQNHDIIHNPELPGPDWLHHRLGDDYFANVCMIRLRKQQISDLAFLADLPRLECLICDTRAVADNEYVLVKLQRLRTLSLYGPPLSDIGIDNLKHLTQLTKIIINGDAATKADVDELRNALPNCQVED